MHISGYIYRNRSGFFIVMMSRSISLFGWIAWFSLLLGMPYLTHEGRYGAVFSSTYGFAALGVLTGFLIGFVFVRSLRLHDASPLNSEKTPCAIGISKIRVWRRLIVAGGIAFMACLLVFQIAAFANFDAAVFGLSSEMPWIMRVFAYVVARTNWLEPFFSFAAAASCSTVFSLVFFRGDRGDFPSGSLSIFVFALAFGFCSRLLWVGIAPAVYGATGFEVEIGCVPIACIPLAFVFVFLLCACLCGPRKCLSGHSFLFRLPVAVIGCSFGILAWSCLGRIAKMSGFVSPQAAFGAVAVVVVVALVCGVLTNRLASSDGYGNSEVSVNEVDARTSRLGSFGLSPRELEASLLLLEGKNSEEAAACMGIKAATVRSLLQRAYKKAGVSNGAGFIAAFGEESVQGRSDSGSTRGPKAEPAKSVVIARSLIAPTAFCFMATCFLPSGLSYIGWGIGREFVYGLGFGFLVAGFAVASVASGFIRIKGESRSKHAWSIGLSLCVFAVASSYFAVSLHLRPLSAEWEKAAAFGASFLFAVLCAWVIFSVARYRGEQTAGIKRAEICAWIAGACVFAVTRAIPCSVAFVCFVLAAGLGFLTAWALRGIRLESEKSSGVFGMESPFAMAALLFAAMTCGFLWEETWRDEGYFSLMDFGSAFCAAACVAVATLLGKPQKYAVVSILAASFLSLALLVVGPTSALVALFALTAVYMVRRSVRERLFDWQGVGDVLFAFGMGFIAGDILINHIGDRLGFGYRAPLFDFLPEGDGARIVALCISSMLFSAAFLSVVTYCIYLRRFVTRSHVLESLSRSADERMVGYLAGRGLSDPHARIVADIAQGKTSGEIIRTRFYSRGSVNDARRKGYALLGVRSQEELARLIRREMGL